MEFIDGSRKDIQTVFPDNFHFFELLAKLVEEEPADVFDPLSRFQMQAIGIEKGKPFNPDERNEGSAIRSGDNRRSYRSRQHLRIALQGCFLLPGS